MDEFTNHLHTEDMCLCLLMAYCTKIGNGCFYVVFVIMQTYEEYLQRHGLGHCNGFNQVGYNGPAGGLGYGGWTGGGGGMAYSPDDQ
jgi:hypothetical protein